VSEWKKDSKRGRQERWDRAKRRPRDRGVGLNALRMCVRRGGEEDEERASRAGAQTKLEATMSKDK